MCIYVGMSFSLTIYFFNTRPDIYIFINSLLNDNYIQFVVTWYTVYSLVKSKLWFSYMKANRKSEESCYLSGRVSVHKKWRSDPPSIYVQYCTVAGVEVQYSWGESHIHFSSPLGIRNFSPHIP